MGWECCLLGWERERGKLEGSGLVGMTSRQVDLCFQSRWEGQS